MQSPFLFQIYHATHIRYKTYPVFPSQRKCSSKVPIKIKIKNKHKNKNKQPYKSKYKRKKTTSQKSRTKTV